MAGSRLVGRDAELALIDGWLGACVEGRPQVVVCRGEAGIGKTRLASAALERAERQGVVGVRSAAIDDPGMPPFWPWQGLIRALAGNPRLRELGIQPEVDDELRRLSPDAVARDGSVPGRSGSTGQPMPGPATTPAEVRFRQFDAVAALIRAASRVAPLLLILDDAHWADEASLLLLGHVAAALTDERAVLWVNTRDAAPQAIHPLGAWAAAPQVHQLPLARLSTAAVGEALEGLTGSAVGPAEVASAYRASQGNPFLLGEIARALRDGHSRTRQGFVTTGGLEAVAARLRRLDPDAVAAIEAAAIAGPEVTAPLVAATLGVEPLDALHALDQAVSAGFLEAGERTGTFAFAHPLVRDLVEARIGPERRVRLHRQAAEALASRWGEGDPGSAVHELARHWREAAQDGDAASASAAAQWLERAGDASSRQLAFEAAARLYRDALDVHPGADGATRVRLLLASGRAHGQAGLPGARFDACLEAAPIARTLGRADLLAEAAMVLEPVGQPGFDLAARRLCREALDSGGLGPALRARVTARFAETFIYLPDVGAARAASAEALEVAASSGDRAALAAALRARQVVVAGPDGLEERELVGRWMSDLGAEVADPGLEMAGRLCLVDAHFERGELAEVAAELDSAARCAEAVGGPVARFLVAHARSVLAQAQGRFAACRSLAAEAQRLMGPATHPVRHHARAGVLAALGRHAGHDATTLAANGVDLGTGADVGAVSPADVPEPPLIAALSRADSLVMAGRLDEARAVYAALGPAAGWRPAPHVVLLCGAFGIEVAAALGADEDVALLHERLEGHRGHHVTCGLGAAAYLGPVELWLGKAAAHLGRHEEARSRFADAERASAAAGAAAYAAESRVGRAASLAEVGRAAEAAAVLEQAARSARALGMRAWFPAMAALEGRAREPRGRLTAREREVAGLVADGLSNREVAERLGLSERTAQNHVQHILLKLDARNRAQVAAWAQRERLSERL